jgi:hypothetical protein
MKAIITIFSVFVLLNLTNAQNTSLANTTCKANQLLTPGSAVMIYSTERQACVLEDTSHSTTPSEVLIKDLPPLTKKTTPVMIRFTKGSYTFKTDPSLILPHDSRVYLEDLLTGKEFDLIPGTSYSFNVSRMIPDRFVLNIRKQELKFSAR